MNLADQPGWRRTSPFAVVDFFASALKSVYGGYGQLAAVVGGLTYLVRFFWDLLGSPGGSEPSVALSVGVASAASLVVVGTVALLRYWRFQFKVEADRVLIRQGVLNRTALDLPFDRIQGINVERSLLDRILGLVTIRLDTAGTGEAEGRLPAVADDLADWLRRRVDERATSAESPTPDQAERTQTAAPGTAATPHPHTKPLLRLGAADMVRIALADAKVFVLVGALLALSQTMGRERWGGLVERVEGLLEGLGSGIAALLIVLFVAASFVVMVVGAVLGHHDYTLWRHGAGYRSRAGLLTQKEVVVETAKIQHVDTSQSLVPRWLRRYRLTAPNVESGGNVFNEADDLAVPLLDGPTAELLRSQIFGDEGRGLTLLPFAEGFKRVSPHYIRSLALRLGGIPIIGGAALVAALAGPAAVASIPFAFACAAWALLSVLVSLQAWRRRGYLHDRDGLASRTGFIGADVVAFLYRKVQSATVKQSPLQRRKGLATLEVLLASDEVTVPWIEHADALALRDYILHIAETSRRRWH